MTKQHGVVILPRASSIFWIRLLQYPAERAIVDGDKFLLDSLDHLAERIARSPAIDAGDDIPGRDRLAVVKFETGPQAEGPGEAVARDFLGLDHLALDFKSGVHAIKCVPHQHARVAGDVGGSPDRVEVGEVRMRHKTHGPRRGAL